uniref:Uncharacterized protein n=1 Tax=Oryza punctata TaxID=4537 RepID=A0A0E0KJT4_ORYPU
MAEWSTLPADLINRIASCFLDTGYLDYYMGLPRRLPRLALRHRRPQGERPGPPLPPPPLGHARRGN